jgi:hypothetical protein
LSKYSNILGVVCKVTDQQITLLLWALYSSVQKGPSCGQPFFGGRKKGVLLIGVADGWPEDVWEQITVRSKVT